LCLSPTRLASSLVNRLAQLFHRGSQSFGDARQTKDGRTPLAALDSRQVCGANSRPLCKTALSQPQGTSLGPDGESKPQKDLVYFDSHFVD
jgi:hypothetical protein